MPGTMHEDSEDAACDATLPESCDEAVAPA
jgi:hypothetical protein